MPYFDFADGSIEERIALTEMLVRVMKTHDGIGLSANQVGLPLRVFVMGEETIRCCFNPEIVGHEGDVLATEGCLSFPGLFLDVKRPFRLHVRYWDVRGEKVEETLEDLWARCFAHETDHLDGVTFTNHVSRLKLERARKRIRKP